MKEATEIVVLLDRSGSMRAMQEEAIGGFNHFLEDQKKEPGEARITLVQFDHVYELSYSGVPVAEARPLTPESYQPRGTTAYLDALGKVINDTGSRLAALPEEQRPNKVLVIVITDGMENASSEFTTQQVLEMVKRQREVYKWDFMFMASNEDALAHAQRLGVGCTPKYDATKAGTRAAFCCISQLVSSYRAGKDDWKASSGVGKGIWKKSNRT